MHRDEGTGNHSSTFLVNFIFSESLPPLHTLNKENECIKLILAQIVHYRLNSYLHDWRFANVHKEMN